MIDAEEIVASLKSKLPTDCEFRIVLNGVGKSYFFYTLPSVTDIENYGQDLYLFKYKIQTKVDNKYIDVNGYEFFFNYKEIKSKFRAVKKICDLSLALLIPIHLHGDPSLIASVLRKLLATFVREQHKKCNLLIVTEYKKQLIKLDNSLIKGCSEYAFFAFYIEALSELVALYGNVDNNELLIAIDAAEGRFSSSGYDKKALRTVTSLLKGQVVSLTDRSSACAFFDESIKCGAELVQAYYIDTGLFTFFQLNEYDGSSETQEVTSSEDFMGYDFSDKKPTCILLSVDSNFLKIYGPNIVFYAGHFHSYHFHITLVVDRVNKEKVLEKFYNFCASWESFVELDIKNRISISVIETPTWVIEEKTFFACARFFSAINLIDHFDDLYIIDADLSIDGEIEPYLKELKHFDFAVNYSRGLNAIPPWRRYTAGNVYLRKKSIKNILEMCRYLAIGLKRSNSWMLDQNALAFAIEEVNSKNNIQDLGLFKRPFYQQEIRQLFERNVLSAQKKTIAENELI